MRERHPFNVTSFTIGVLALGGGALYLLTTALDTSWDVDLDPVYVGGGVLLLVSLLGIIRALAELRRPDEVAAEAPETL